MCEAHFSEGNATLDWEKPLDIVTVFGLVIKT